ncbi:MAG: hypothetical protein SynsKO_09550 [Synoicihabitans sp.]
MTSLRYLLLGLILTAPLHAAIFGKKNRGEPDILIVGDTFGHDAEKIRPSKDNPITYMHFVGKQRDMGAIVAGEKMPRPDQIEALIDRTMQSQGFVRREVGDAVPDIFIVHTYGSAYVPESVYDNIEFDEESGEFSGQTVAPDIVGDREMFALAGGAKVLQNGAKRDELEDVRTQASIDRLFVMIAAIDGEKFYNGEAEILWRTRISIPTIGYNLPDNMNLMLETAAPYLAAETSTPVILREEDRRETEVEIGDLEVIEDDG